MSGDFSFGPGDVAPGENAAKVSDALARFRFEEARDLAAFDEGFRFLDALFGPLNEMERREVLERWFVQGSLSPPTDPIRARYHMLLVRDDQGTLVAVRDCFCAIDPLAPRIVVLLSHSLVLPPWRRTGIAGLLRAAPAVFARNDADEAGLHGTEILLVTEMEPVDLTAPETVVRLVAYSRAAFRVIPPQLAPYAQPDFRDVEALGVPAAPIPFVLLVRQVEQEDRATLTWERFTAILDGLGAIHRPSVYPPQVAEIRQYALQHADPTPGAVIPLLPAPIDPANPNALAPLLRSAVHPLFPENR